MVHLLCVKVLMLLASQPVICPADEGWGKQVLWHWLCCVGHHITCPHIQDTVTQCGRAACSPLCIRITRARHGQDEQPEAQAGRAQRHSKALIFGEIAVAFEAVIRALSVAWKTCHRNQTGMSAVVTALIWCDCHAQEDMLITKMEIVKVQGVRWRANKMYQEILV